MKALISILLFSSLTTANAGSCPEKTPQEWAEFFMSKTATIIKDNYPSRYYNGQTHDELKQIAEDCAATFQLNGVNQCADRIIQRSKLRILEDDNDHSMGWEVSDSDYINAVPQGYLDLPDEFKDGLPDNYAEIAKNKGWKMLEYRSRTVPNPPNRSFSRVLFLVEGEKVDKWIQFTLPESSEKKEQLIDFIAMEKPTSPGDKATPYYTQYWRDKQSRNPKMRTQGEFDNCYSCHPNGMRELSPEPGSYSSEGADNLGYMRQAMKNYTVGRGSVDYKGALHPEQYGPPMGEGQGCVKCHNNGQGMHQESRGAINSRTDSGHIQHKMTQDMTMPVSMIPMEKDFFDFMNDIPKLLTETERKNLMSVTARYKWNQGAMYGAIIDWMKANDKIDKEKERSLRFTLNGHPTYPNCEDQPDCFKGLKRYNNYLSTMKNDYPEQYKAWLDEGCIELLPDSQQSTVNDGQRSQGFLESFSDFLNDDEDSSSEEGR
ncbi:MAG: hypothetical protein COW01_14090 [Bdellovibrionales bacterium CG12_big_fil_rev_8_21_14_0_65_38_15]|nr:MAG: hypothetical protein COW79_16910 [Bdellovibrionales bacterium CG22_combo_CG10-13_8_21_14_all_38_13]PIQ53403.1 MAG: hypothetical protein COW01_14090 [Bdellovibrionales bacterium CG12_big_fil_rev_8_21_14_0_65_38_15]PIR30234.1 MAG: hypothetical protein COV38_05665 [Bdellovibrionales bacterium CG11_big_fil_rev_8_21_14_0_20_38_13]